MMDETAPEMLNRLGTDAAKWAAEFRQTAIRLGYSDMDEGWLIGWFANAIERTRAVDRWAREAAEAAATPTHRHVRTGGLYTVLHRGAIEADLKPAVIYRGENGRVWVRPAAEFDDGRFEPLPAPPKETPDAR